MREFVAIDNDGWAYRLGENMLDWLELGEDIEAVFDQQGNFYELVETRKGLVARPISLDPPKAFNLLQNFFLLHGEKLGITHERRTFGDLFRAVPRSA